MTLVLDASNANYYLQRMKPRIYRKIARVLAVELDESAVIETREGTVRANRGDFLVVNEDEKDPHPWPVNRDIFLRSYQEVQK